MPTSPSTCAPSRVPFVLVPLLAALAAGQAQAAGFTISGSASAPQTLSSGTGAITASGTLNVSNCSAGRTSGTGTPLENVANRDRSHHMSAKGYGPAALDKSLSNGEAIRGREQQMIDANGGAQSVGGTSGNAINGISSTNPNRDTYLDAAKREFGQ